MDSVLQKIIKNEINLNAYKGKTWVLVPNTNKTILNDFLNLEHQLIKEGKIVKSVVAKTPFKDGTIYKFEDSVVQNTLKISIAQLQQKNNLPPIEPLNLIKIKMKVVEDFCKYLDTIKTDKVDVLLYSSFNNTNKTLFINYKTESYKMILRQVCLSAEDIKQVNQKLSTYGKKIATIEQKDYIGPEDGIRYTLQLTKADFI